MQPNEFWKMYIGDEKPAALMERLRTRDPETCIARYLARLPSLYGIALRGDWRTTFAAERQCDRFEVARGLTAYLEETREDWEPALCNFEWAGEDPNDGRASVEPKAADAPPPEAPAPAPEQAPGPAPETDGEHGAAPEPSPRPQDAAPGSLAENPPA